MALARSPDSCRPIIPSSVPESAGPQLVSEPCGFEYAYSEAPPNTVEVKNSAQGKMAGLAAATIPNNGAAPTPRPPISVEYQKRRPGEFSDLR